MICFLARFFVKNYKQVDSPYVRQSYGMLSGAFGIAFNIVLVIFKMLAGLISGSIAVFSDALNNLSDVISAVVTLVFFKLSGAEADKEHPFGHGRLEYVAGLIVSLFIIIMSVELMQGSVKKIITPEEIAYSPLVLVILILSMGVKFFMFASYLQAAKAIKSTTINSMAFDSLSDVLSTGIVLLSLIVYSISGKNIDGIAGVVIAFFILKTGIDSAKDTINPLLGEPPTKEMLREIEDTVMAGSGILGVHDIVVHNYGPSRIMMSLHVEVSYKETLTEVHDLIDEIEKELHARYHCTAVIHVDPIDVDDAERARVKGLLSEITAKLNPAIRYHDLRVIRKQDKPPKVEFDLEVPYKFQMKDEELISLVTQRIRQNNPDYVFDITVDRGEDE
jgi:cation diffusion facilitator family transporter